jgi:hypothetical protein
MNLEVRPPRRWSEKVNGICWLPRLIDKARAYEAGTLGAYFFGQSPVDANLLKAGGFRYDDVLESIRGRTSDAEVLAELERRSPGATERMRAWTAKPGPIDAFTFFLVDIDEGYAGGPLAPLIRALPIDPLAKLTRKLLPLRRRAS